YLPVRAGRKDIPEYVDRIIARALRPERSERFDSVSAFASALRAGAAFERRTLRARTWAIGAIAVATLAGIGLASFKEDGGTGARTPELGRVVVAPLDNRTGTPSLDVVGLM